MMTDCNNPKHGQFNSMDRLSDLPDFIIHLIMSYLDTEEAYRTSILSKRWNKVFATNPILDFYHREFPIGNASRILKYIDTRMQKFSKENLRITTFKLRTFKFALRGTNLLLRSKVDGWLEIAVRNQVTEIFLRGPTNYKLPRILFRAESLRRLDCEKLEMPYCEDMDLASLESLVLRDVVVEERMLRHIVSSCPLLKDLRLSFCHGFKNLVIPRCSKLEYLYTEGNLPWKVILETSSLRSFTYLPKYEYPWPIISNRGLLRNLRVLTVYDLSITEKALAELLPELDSLEKLQLTFCERLRGIKISHTQLKQICLVDCQTLFNVVIDAPCLTEFKIHGEIDPSLSITILSEANCNIHVHTMARYFDTDGFFKLKKLLKGLKSCSVLKIMLLNESSVFWRKICIYEIEFDEEKSKIAELGPLCDIGELKLDLSYWEHSSSLPSAFLNGLFWICHPNIVSLRVDSDRLNLTVEPFLGKLEDMVKCPTHPLKRIQVEEIHNDSDDFHGVQIRLYW